VRAACGPLGAHSRAKLMRKALKILGFAAFVGVIGLTVYVLSAKCGDRWSVKTLSDLDRSRVSFIPVAATVGELRKLASPAHPPKDRREAPVELTTFVVRGRIIGIQKMGDRDFHLVIGDLRDPSQTMITELVDPEFVGSAKRSEVERMKEARRTLVLLMGTPQTHFTKAGFEGNIEVIGVGFFDCIHAETGAAPNGIELHPVLGLRRVE
jgi:hypothetical protein